MALVSVPRSRREQSASRRIRQLAFGRYRPQLEELERRDLLAATLTPPVYLDFGTATSPAAPGYTEFALAAYSSAVGYGWQKTSQMSALDRGTADPLTRDFHQGRDSTFLVNVPNGAYDVVVTLGDARAAHDKTAIWLEGQQVASGLNTLAGQFLQRTFRVQVSDGQLTLRIADGGGISRYFAIDALAVLPVAVANVPPTVDIGGPYAGIAGLPIAFAARATDPSPADTAAGFTYSWSFGDGSGSNQRTPTHAYSAAGTYNVSVTVMDVSGGRTTVTTTATVSPVQTFRSVSGVYSLCIPDAPVPQTILTNPYVDGIALRTTWGMIETADGVYDWSYLDSQIAAAATAGKKVSISIPAGVNTPAWVYDAGAASFTFIDKNSPSLHVIPVPWDPVFLAEWQQFVRALGARYAANPAVVSVKVTGINATTEEAMLPHSTGQSVTNGTTTWTTTNDVANWQKIGYTPQKVKNAWLAIADTFALAFPANQMTLVIVPNGFPPIDNNGQLTAGSADNQIVNDLITQGIARYGTRLIVQNDGLSDFWVSNQVAGVATQVTTGYQMLWRVTNDSTGRMNNYVTPFDPQTVLAAAVDKGLASNARFLEIYQMDILNADLQTVLANAQLRTANLAPAATILGAPVSGHSPEGTPITLSAKVTDGNAVDSASGFFYAWTVTRNGEAYASGSAAAFTFTPNDDGLFVASLTVTDRDGARSAPSSVTITVDNVAPLVILGGT